MKKREPATPCECWLMDCGECIHYKDGRCHHPEFDQRLNDLCEVLTEAVEGLKELNNELTGMNYEDTEGNQCAN